MPWQDPSSSTFRVKYSSFPEDEARAAKPGWRVHDQSYKNPLIPIIILLTLLHLLLLLIIIIMFMIKATKTREPDL